MDQYTQGRMTRQVRRVRQCRRQVVQEQDVCFTKLLPQEQIEAALERHQVRYRERRYTPLVTIWTFLYQVLSSDQSCRAAVARLLAFWCVGKKEGGSAKTDPYCKARERLPEKLLADLAQHSGAALQQEVPAPNLLGGRPLKIADGTTLSMPDTPANQKAYPQQRGQKPGLGFPVLRLVGLISLSCGAVLDVALGPYRGKRTGETALLRQLLERLEAGDILLTDALFSHYWTIALLLERGVDFLGRHAGTRRVDFRRGQRLGRYDHVVSWSKPHRPSWMSRKLYDRLPDTLQIRETQVEVTQKGFRCRQLRLVTTLAGRPGLLPAGIGDGVPLPLAGGAGSAFHQGRDADGRAAVQESGDGPQGDLDAPAGLQSDPPAHGPGRGHGRGFSSRPQLQRDPANAGRLRRRRLVVSGAKEGVVCGGPAGGGHTSCQ